ncbi:uncharacterized protein CIMG_03954 [Coccidioides immitis RS]|uniref:Uncharacterized protein n=3 Tax=Coccidioides immitis TaxID=5501 RepID=J3KCG5_COCIM|nr:uncharacterized protein CIMG_03954 [Coccidioides immitis RS]EAS32930.3 hypothetical protein CIMG_03954 [Coccidioides immitis RS]KMP08206.1 hypothetical protein CIRG_07887 [Coccidioides immitis RMSCC 2394]KMU89913.1 hypothetical protein CIHG_07596 [Coccidioides immitis H538.4]
MGMQTSLVGHAAPPSPTLSRRSVGTHLEKESVPIYDPAMIAVRNSWYCHYVMPLARGFYASSALAVSLSIWTLHTNSGRQWLRLRAVTLCHIQQHFIHT